MKWYFIVLLALGLLLVLLFLVYYIFFELGFWDKLKYILCPKLKQKEEERRRKIQQELERTKKLDSEYKYINSGVLRMYNTFPIHFEEWNKFVIYYEKSYNEPVNKYIKEHYQEIVDKLYSEHVTFIYLPAILENITEYVSYNNPGSCISGLKKYSAADFYQIITENIVNVPSNNPMFIIPDPNNSARYPKEMIGDFAFSCYCCELNYINDKQFEYIINKHLNFIQGHFVVRYSIAEYEGENKADFSSIEIIAKEIQTRINTLYAMGVSEYVISQIVSLPKPKLSPLMITEDFRIILPDYNNMEIPMPTLSKTLYFFYLNHPEGVLFKELRDHKEELYEIYGMVSLREDVEKMKHSIEDIVDSTKNSVNEKCSRIRAAFISKFNDNLAHNYYITGNAGEPKKITLDRLLIIDNSKVLKLNSPIPTSIQ